MSESHSEEFESMNSREYEAAYLAYVASLKRPDGTYKHSPQCPNITVDGKPYCLVAKPELCIVCSFKGVPCPPYMSYDEAKVKADLWIEPNSSRTITIKRRGGC